VIMAASLTVDFMKYPACRGAPAPDMPDADAEARSAPGPQAGRRAGGQARRRAGPQAGRRQAGSLRSLGYEGLTCHLMPWPVRTRCSASPNSSRGSGSDSSGRASIAPLPISSTAGAKLRRIAIEPVTVISSL
jgi:hypothetical protein